MKDRGFGEKDQRWKSSKSPILWMVRCQLHRWHCVIGNTGLWVESREAGNQRGKRTLCLELVKVCMSVGHQTRDVWWYLETWVRSLGDSLGLEIKTWPSSSRIYPVETGGPQSSRDTSFWRDRTGESQPRSGLGLWASKLSDSCFCWNETIFPEFLYLPLAPISIITSQSPISLTFLLFSPTLDFPTICHPSASSKLFLKTTFFLFDSTTVKSVIAPAS